MTQGTAILRNGLIYTKKSPHFEFWHTLLWLEYLMLMLVRSLRIGNFEILVEVLDKFLPCLFSLNHIHYARWLSVYIQA